MICSDYVRGEWYRLGSYSSRYSQKAFSIGHLSRKEIIHKYLLILLLRSSNLTYLNMMKVASQFLVL